VARGGRYDEIGRVFGRARPATGFSTDLRTLMLLGRRVWPARADAILAPLDTDAALAETVRSLRAAGEVVVQQLPGQEGNFAEMGCTRRLRWNGSKWLVEPLP
jgi:ATP phosphoribosyltransferase regulatory subunit